MSKIIKSTILTALLMRYVKRNFSKGLRLLFIAILVAVLTSTVAPVSETQAAITRTIDVDNINDSAPGDGCTLREAIDVVNAGLGAGPAVNGCIVVESGAGTLMTYEINLPSYTYTLSGAAGNDDNTSGDLDIIASVTINGAGAGSTIIDGGDIDRIFHLPISGLGLTVNISNVTVQNGRVTGSSGGGVFSVDGAVTISDSTISNNRASFGGGGIYNTGGTVTISNSTVANNKAGNRGGGIYNTGGTVDINNSNITDNEAGAYGGGIVYSTVTISNSIIANNTTAGRGGGIMGFWGNNTLNVIDSTILGNAAFGSETYEGGGGVLIAAGGNTVNIANSTISGNLANSSGGGISSAGTVNLTNVTITNNIADNDNNGNGDGGGIYRDGGTVSVKNTIVAGNSDRSGGGPDCFGDFVSQQYNLIGINSGCVTSFPAGNPNGNNDFVGTGGFPLDPLLGGLAGDPSYHVLQLGSPAIDKISAANCTFISSGANPLFTNGAPVTTDQPGTVRDSACDIGAFEVPPLGIQVLDGITGIPDDTGSVDFGSTMVGTPITKTFIVKNIGKTTALTLSDLTVPAGFSIANNFGSTTVVTGAQTTFAIKLDATAALTFSGQLSFTNNVVNKNPFNFAIYGTAVQLALIKTASSDAALPGQTLTYTLVISNGGGTNVTNAFISDTLPAGLNFVGPVILHPPGTALLPPNLPALASGLTIPARESITLTFPVTVSQGLVHNLPLTNTAAVTSNEVTSPVIDTKVITVDNPAKLSLTKAVDNNIPRPGQTITYTLAIQNSGGQNATNALISDTLPSGLNFVGPIILDPPGSALLPPSLPTLASGLTIAAGESITLTFPVTVGDSLDPGDIITNTAAITSAEVLTPVIGKVKIVIGGRKIYLPLVLKNS